VRLPRWFRARPRAVVLDNREGQEVPSATPWGGRWVVRCEAHGPFLVVGTRRTADALAGEPQSFCEACRPTFHGRR
jgi:hypothetical protein